MGRTERTDLDTVLSVLADIKTYPGKGQTESSRNMLIAGLPFALRSPSGGEAHTFQKGLVGLTEAALAAMRAMAVEALEGCEEEARAADQRFSLAQVAVCDAAEAIPVKREEREVKAAAVKEVEAEVASAEKYFNGLEKIKEEVLTLRGEAKGRKKAADAAISALEKLKTESGEEQDTAAVMDCLSLVCAEQALMAAAPHALAAKPSERRQFDNTTLQEIARVLGQTSTKVEEELAAGAEGEADAEAEALGAWAILDIARERLGEAKFALNQTQRAIKAAESAEEAAKTNVESCRAAVSATLVQQTLTEARIQELDVAIAALARCARPPASADAPAIAEDVSMTPADSEATCIPAVIKVDAPVMQMVPDPARLGA
mmetsp:Transcript_2670/g.8281  ORF Transcript_2670/g.8281 Transcript_2670/m.8281 type:complete len:375 (+) Transcript_2670:77-1201(+)